MKKEFMVRITRTVADYVFVDAYTKEEALSQAKENYFNGLYDLTNGTDDVDFQSGDGIEIAERNEGSQGICKEAIQ